MKCHNHTREFYLQQDLFLVNLPDNYHVVSLAVRAQVISHPTTNRIPSLIYRVLVRMNLLLRFRRAAIAATIFLIALSLIAPAIAAADTGNLAPITTMPANNTPLAELAAHGTIAPQSSFEKLGNREITLFRFEMNNATFPGPRDMAFGPRYIQLTTNIGALLIITAAACVAVLAFVIYRRRKAAANADAEDIIDNAPENGDEKQD